MQILNGEPSTDRKIQENRIKNIKSILDKLPVERAKNVIGIMKTYGKMSSATVDFPNLVEGLNADEKFFTCKSIGDEYKR